MTIHSDGGYEAVRNPQDDGGYPSPRPTEVGHHRPVRCGAVSPEGNQCRGLAGHLDTAPLGRHYAYPVESHALVVMEEWQ